MSGVLPKQKMGAGTREDVKSLEQALASARAEAENSRQSRSEVIELRATIQALRNELEQEHHRKQREVQEAVSIAQEEIHELRRTVQALRDRMEAERSDHNAKQQEIRLQSKEEQRELQLTIVALREKLETPHDR